MALFLVKNRFSLKTSHMMSASIRIQKLIDSLVYPQAKLEFSTIFYLVARWEGGGGKKFALFTQPKIGLIV